MNEIKTNKPGTAEYFIEKANALLNESDMLSLTKHIVILDSIFSDGAEAQREKCYDEACHKFGTCDNCGAAIKCAKS